MDDAIEYVVMSTESNLQGWGYSPFVIGRFLWDGSRYFGFVHYEWDEDSEISFADAVEMIAAYQEELLDPVVMGLTVSGWAVIPDDSEQLKWAKMVHDIPTDNDNLEVGVFRLR